MWVKVLILVHILSLLGVRSRFRLLPKAVESHLLRIFKVSKAMQFAWEARDHCAAYAMALKAAKISFICATVVYVNIFGLASDQRRD